MLDGHPTGCPCRTDATWTVADPRARTRIAEAGKANKQLIHKYFGSKDRGVRRRTAARLDRPRIPRHRNRRHIAPITGDAVRPREPQIRKAARHRLLAMDVVRCETRCCPHSRGPVSE
jgi:hypothetical protein